MGCYACRQELSRCADVYSAGGVGVGMRELLCDNCCVTHRCLDFWAVGWTCPLHVPSDLKPWPCSLVMTAWGDVHGHLGELVGSGSGSPSVRV